MDDVTFAIIEALREADESVLSGDADICTVVPEPDGAGGTTVFADGSFVRDWTPKEA